MNIMEYLAKEDSDMREFKIEESPVFGDNINVRFVEFSWDEQPHKHDGIEMVYIIDGMAEHIINGNRIRMKKGSILIMNKECVHSFKNIVQTKYFNFLFKPCFLSEGLDDDLKKLFSFYGEDISDNFIHIDLNQEYIDKIEDLILEIQKESTTRERGYLNFIKIRVAEFINIIIRNYENRSKDYNIVDSKFSEILEHIKENCCGELELKSVAEKFGYSSSYFSYILKKDFGLSFKQLVVKKRLEKALHCLKEDKSSINEIIYKCGFSNKTYFYEMFKKQFGMKPKEMRDNMRNYLDGMNEKSDF